MKSETERANDVIVEISPEREKFFGCSGKMLCPCAATVAALIREIPADKLLTTDLLRRELARRHQVEVACPSETKKSLKAIARDSGQNVPYWRVVKKDGTLIADFPGGRDGHAARLTQAGFALETPGNAPKVRNLRGNLMRFE